MGWLRQLGDALDARVGHRALLQAALDEPVPGGARFAYAFGSVLVVLLGLQAVTGVALAFIYSPSVNGAWASVAYLESSVPAGALVRGLHHFGASALVATLGCHAIQVALFGAYRKPREITWWSGLALGGLVLAFALTGYLLPWDQRGYWATKVATGLAGSLPVAGPLMQRLLEGGSGLGNLTLTRFYALHVLVLPAGALLLLALHLLAFRRHGVTPHWKVKEGDTVGRFWPDQIWRDAFLALVAVGATLGLALWFGAPLQAPADPAGHLEPRPEWYFLPLYELLKLFSGPWEIAATALVPLLIAAFLVGLPLLDRRAERNPIRRWRPLLALGILLCAAVGLGARSVWNDRHDARVLETEAQAASEAQLAIALARGGVPPEGPRALLDADPTVRGRKIFAQRCEGCHAPPPPGVAKAPRLAGYTPEWIEGLLRNPDAELYYGHTKAMGGMESYTSIGSEQLHALSSFLAVSAHSHDQPPTDLAVGRRAFGEANCDTCHSLVEGEVSVGPNLAGYGSDRWLSGLLDDPGGPLYFDKLNEMPSFRGKLSGENRTALLTYLRSLGAAGSP